MIGYLLRGLARRRLRTVMGVLGVFCTLALLTAVHLGLESISVSYLDLVSLQAGRADVLIRREGSEALKPESFDPAAAEKTIGEGSVLRGFAPRLMGIRPIGDRFALIVGIDPAREKELGLEGFVPWPDLKNGGVALSESLAGHFKSVESLMIGEGTLYRKGGTIQRQQMFPQHIRDYLVADLATARELLGEPQGVHVLAGALKDPRSCYDARDLRGSVRRLKDAGEALAELLGPEHAVTLPKAAAITAFEQAAGPLRAVFGIFAGVALAITALLVYSLLSVSVEERTREHAILRIVGAKRRHLAGLVLGESALLCLLGVLPGVLAGALAARGVLALVGLAMGGGTETLTLELSGATARFCLIAGTLVCVASAVGPALRASRRRIADALDPLRRGQLSPDPVEEGGTPRALLWVGLALSAVSGTVFFILPTAFLSGDPSLIGGVALGLLVAIVIGFTLVAVAAGPVLERVVLRVLGPCFGPAGELAARNLSGHRRRSVTTSLMFALSVSFVIFLASLGSLFSRTSMGIIERRVGSDLKIGHLDPKEEGLRATLEAVPGVGRVAGVAHLRSRTAEGIAYDVVASDLVGLKHLWVIPVGADASLSEVIDPAQAEFSEGDASSFRALEEGGKLPGAILSLSMARHLEVGRDDVITLSFRLGAQREDVRVKVLAVAGVIPGFDGLFRSRAANAQGSGVLLSRKAFDAMTQAAPREAFEGFGLVKVSGDARETAKGVRELLSLRYGLGVECAEEEKREAEALYWGTQALFALLLAVAVAIAFFGLVASMATAAIERRREIGILKAVGMRRGSLQKMFAAEAVALTVSSGALGGGMGFLLAWLFIMQAALLMEVPAAFAPPWITFAATFVICSGAGLVAAWLPTRGLLKRPVAEILRGA